MGIGVIFDLDQTLIDSRLAEPHRGRNWDMAYAAIPSFSSYENMGEVLAFIQTESIPFCIVTSAPSSYCTRVCKHWNIDYTKIVCYHDYQPNKKPHPRPIKMGLDLLQIAPNKVLSFGDRDIDIIASKAANVVSVACLWGAEEKERLLATNPDFTLNHPKEIIELVKIFSSENQ